MTEIRAPGHPLTHQSTNQPRHCGDQISERKKKRPQTSSRAREGRPGISHGCDDSSRKSEEVKKAAGGQSAVEGGRAQVERQISACKRQNGICQEVLRPFNAGHQEYQEKESHGDTVESNQRTPPTDYRANRGVIAAVLDATGMKAGDQYLAEAKALHIEAGHGWEVQLDRRMSTCRRAMQRDKGPEVRAKEAQPRIVSKEEWERRKVAEKEPARVA